MDKIKKIIREVISEQPAETFKLLKFPELDGWVAEQDKFHKSVNPIGIGEPYIEHYYWNILDENGIYVGKLMGDGKLIEITYKDSSGPNQEEIETKIDGNFKDDPKRAAMILYLRSKQRTKQQPHSPQNNFNEMVGNEIKFDDKISNPTLSELQKSLESKYGITLTLMNGHNNDIVISKIVVQKEKRSEGIGTAVMNELIKYADEAGRRIVLTPSKDFGATSTHRLKRFYRQFGFVDNRGRNKDFSTSYSMFRNAKKNVSESLLSEEKSYSPLNYKLGHEISFDNIPELTAVIDLFYGQPAWIIYEGVVPVGILESVGSLLFQTSLNNLDFFGETKKVSWETIEDEWTNSSERNFGSDIENAMRWVWLKRQEAGKRPIGESKASAKNEPTPPTNELGPGYKIIYFFPNLYNTVVVRTKMDKLWFFINKKILKPPVDFDGVWDPKNGKLYYVEEKKYVAKYTNYETPHYILPSENEIKQMVRVIILKKAKPEI